MGRLAALLALLAAALLGLASAEHGSWHPTRERNWHPPRKMMNDDLNFRKRQLDHAIFLAREKSHMSAYDKQHSHDENLADLMWTGRYSRKNMPWLHKGRNLLASLSGGGMLRHAIGEIPHHVAEGDGDAEGAGLEPGTET
mmetsp:Transcript_11236/g.35617  ORF Transcript_11236/g.35617 Transcript_11236/m.35617 type:complete len:141 (-) Transcript_11236:291-713(-)